MILGGIDAGGTATKCILVDEKGKVLAMSEAGPANYQVVGLRSAVQEIKTALTQALIKVGIEQVDILGIGMAGAGRPDDLVKIRNELDLLPGVKELFLTDDGEIAVLGAHAGKPGVVVIAGTGSIVYGLKRDGTKIRRGGWGPLLGDEGSGFWIGLKALKAVIKAEERRGPVTILTERICEFLELQDLRKLIPLVYQEKLPRKLIASLTPLVIEVMEEDGVARKIVADGLDELVLTIQSAYQELELPIETGVIGGLFNNPKIFELFEQKLREAGDYKVIKPRYTPVYGAVFFGAREKDVELDILKEGQ